MFLVVSEAQSIYSPPLKSNVLTGLEESKTCSLRDFYFPCKVSHLVPRPESVHRPNVC